MAASEPEAGATDICVRCGLCCDGSLFKFTPLDENKDEGLVRTLEANRVVIVPDASDPGKSGMVQPCQCSSPTGCKIYLKRPSICRAYRCKTLQQLELGEIDEAEAQARVTITISARQELQCQLEQGETLLAARERWLALRDPLDGSLVDAIFRVRSFAFNLLLDQYFRYDDRQLMSYPNGN